MNIKLVVFLALFPVSLWAAEMFIRWALNDPEAMTFLGPSIAGAALGLIGQVAVPKPVRQGISDERDRNASFAGLLALVFGFAGWIVCLGLNIKKDVPPVHGFAKEDLQFAVSILMYVLGIVLTMWKEPNQ
jgi:hypothetical protein